MGRVFLLDPKVASRREDLQPNSSSLDDFSAPVTLERLGGHGVLEGAHVRVLNHLGCDDWFGAYDTSGAFSYPHGDTRFQEVMAYYWGDRYRSTLAADGVLQPAQAVTVFAHCLNGDNAFYLRALDRSGNVVRRVCLGDSRATPGAFYADDAAVTIHELQHATTTDTYDPDRPLNQYWYDEAGVLNEAISDFMTLVFEQPLLPPDFDPRLFSRWALGTFTPGQRGLRGANRCPTYDPRYPDCGDFPAFSAERNTVSYVYPDGMGWPYVGGPPGMSSVAQVFTTHDYQEDIHGSAVVPEGALWDVYEAIRANHGGDAAAARTLSYRLVMEAVRHLPRPSLQSLSPVTIRGLAGLLVEYGPLVGLSGADHASMVSALTARGLLGGTPLEADWASVGAGNGDASPGIYVEDDANLLRKWLVEMSETPAAATLVPRGQGAPNHQLDPGELAAIWFDLRNGSERTAGGIELTVTSLDPDVVFDPQANVGASEGDRSSAQILYGKINGASIVAALSAADPARSVPTGNSYFSTNPAFRKSFTTALWVRVSAGAAHGKTARFRVVARPSNGAASTVEFQAKIR